MSKTESDYRFQSKPDRMQGQMNRHDRDGNWLLGRLIDEFGIDTFSSDDVSDALGNLTDNASPCSGRTINVDTALKNLIQRGLVEGVSSDDLLEVTVDGRVLAESLDGIDDDVLQEDEYN